MAGTESPVKVELGVKQKMRDGVNLSADIFRPDAKGKFPVIVTRTPYRTVEGFQERQNAEAVFFAKRGYAYIIQDCRGKNDSEGVYRPFQDDDARDGYDTLAWAAEQEWSDGSLGTTGASYAAWNQWNTATLRPPGLKAMACTVSLPDPVLNVPYQNGALVLWMAEWMATIEGRRNTHTSLYDSKKLFWHLPLKTMDEQFGRKDSRIWQEWIAHPSADGYWKRAFYEDKLDRVDVPVLHISGWYDDDLIGTHVNYLAMTDVSSRPARTRKSQKLIIGPWQHRVNAVRKLGDVDFGETALIDLQGTKLRWFDRWLKGVQNGIEEEPPVEIFTTGRNEWRRYGRWPVDAKSTRYYLRSRGGANTAYGDGLLSTRKPADEEDEPSDRYSYDPVDPVPNIDDQGNAAEGPFDQRPIERRDDVLVYSTPPLGSEVEVSGRVTVELFASTSARDTDFWAQLTDVFPNGYSMHLTEGIIRGRYRESLEEPRLLKPGDVNKFAIDLWIISHEFQREHRIRLDVSSSSFPKYDRNPNTGNPFGQDSIVRTAEQQVFHDRRYPSSVILPVVGRRKGSSKAAMPISG